MRPAFSGMHIEVQMILTSHMHLRIHMAEIGQKAMSILRPEYLARASRDVACGLRQLLTCYQKHKACDTILHSCGAHSVKHWLQMWH